MRLLACVGLLSVLSAGLARAGEEAPPAKRKPLELTEGWGTIEGQIVLEGEPPPPAAPIANSRAGAPILDERLIIDPETRGIRNVVIYLKKAPGNVHPQLRKSAQSHVDLKGDNLQFKPRVLHVRTDQIVRFSSADGLDYSFNVTPLTNTSWNLLARRGQEPMEIRFPRPESLPVSVRSDLYAWMQAYLVVTDHPYVAITDNDGRFRIEGLPAGEHGFTIWHERAGYLERRWTVDARSKETRVLPAVKVPLEKLKRAK